MATFNTDNFTEGQGLSLDQEMKAIGVTETPVLSYILALGNTKKATGRIHSWITRELDNTDSSAKPEGENPLSNFVTSQRKQLNSPLEIFSKGTSISRTADDIENSAFAREIADRLVELKREMNRKLILGTANDGSNGAPRTMKGLMSYLQAANTVEATSLTEAAIKSGLKVLYDNGTNTGTNIVGICNIDTKEMVDAIYENKFSYTKNVDVSFGANAFGMRLDTLQSNYAGSVRFLVDRNMPDGTIVFANADYLSAAFLRQPTYFELARTGDVSRTGYIVSEFTLQLDAAEAVSQVKIASGARTASK